MEGSEEMAKEDVITKLGEERAKWLNVAVLKDAELMAKGTRGSLCFVWMVIQAGW